MKRLLGLCIMLALLFTLCLAVSAHAEIDCVYFVENEYFIDEDYVQLFAGDSITLEVEVEFWDEEEPVTYRWEKDNEPISGANSSKYSTGPLTESASFTCYVTDSEGNEESAYCFVEVMAGDWYIESDWWIYTVDYNETVTLDTCVHKRGSDILTYEWSNHVDTFKDATGATYTTPPITKFANYWCTITDQNGRSEIVGFEVHVQNDIQVDPDPNEEHNITLKCGASKTISVTASCDRGKLSYQWYEGIQEDEFSTTHSPIENATGSSYTLPHMTKPEMLFMCEITDEYDNYKNVYYRLTVSSEGHTFVPDIDKKPTCTKEGHSSTCTCSVCGYVTKKETTIPALGHSWGKPVYSFSTDFSTATATRTCTNDPSHKETETVNTTKTVDGGTILYTAVFTNPAFTKQTHTGHLPVGKYDYNGGHYNIAENGTATFTGPVKKTVKKFTVPDTIIVENTEIKVIAIGSKAFSKAKKLSEVTIGKNVMSIGKNAFASCKKLKTVKGCAGVTSIGNNAFASCPVLEKLPSFKKVTSVGTKAFSGDISLKKISFGAALKKIGKGAFSGCVKLATIDLSKSKGLKTVGASAFKGVSPKVTFKCPKKKKAAFEKLLRKKGAPKTAKFK